MSFIFAAVAVPPPQVQALCSIVVWYDPEPVFCEDIVGYDARFFHPQLFIQNVTRRVGANGTFYIIQEEDGLDANQKDLYVQVAKVIIILLCHTLLFIDSFSCRCESFTKLQESGMREFPWVSAHT